MLTEQIAYEAGAGSLPYQKAELRGNRDAERKLFEAYMRGHAWYLPAWDEKLNYYGSPDIANDIVANRLFGVWRDRGYADKYAGQTTIDLSLPDLKSELDRKHVETISWLVNRYETGQITKEAVFVGFQTIFNLVSGLIGTDLLTMAIESCGLESHVMAPQVVRRVFVAPQSESVLILIHSSDSYEYFVANTRGKKAKYVFDSINEARAMFEARCDKLISDGFKEIK